MNKRKAIIILSISIVVCVCFYLCLISSNKDKQTTISNPVVDDTDVTSSPKQEEVIPVIPNIVQGDDGIGVEVVEFEEEQQSNKQEESEHQKPIESTIGLSSKAKEYVEYCAMTSEEQYNYYKTFESTDSFMEWYNTVKQAYEEENPITELKPGEMIDLGGE